MALKWHPDKHTGSEEDKAKAEKMFREINEAMGVLGDNDKRTKHDQGFDLDDINSGRADMPNFADMGGMGGMPGFTFMSGGGMPDMDGGMGGIDVEDIF